MTISKGEAASMLYILTAYAEGKQIQVARMDCEGKITWYDIEGPMLDAEDLVESPMGFRIKPEPRIVYIGETNGNLAYNSCVDYEFDATPPRRCIKFVEVIE